MKDDGVGFKKEVLDKIGNPFISNKNDENSLGLGIFIAKNLIENASGKINFANLPQSKGSKVEIVLNREII